MTSGAAGGALQDIASLTLARDLRDLALARRSRAHSPRLLHVRAALGLHVLSQEVDDDAFGRPGGGV